MDNLYTGQLSCHFFLTSKQPEGENLGPKLHPGGGFFWTTVFYNRDIHVQIIRRVISNYTSYNSFLLDCVVYSLELKWYLHKKVEKYMKGINW